jgi:hypothetical protein
MNKLISKVVPVLFAISLLSCNPNDREKVKFQEANSATPVNENLNISYYPEDNFKYDSKNKLQQISTNGEERSYVYHDQINNFLFRIAVLDLTDYLMYASLGKIDSAFKKTYFDEYIKQLNNEKTEYEWIKFLNKDALLCEYIVTNHNMISSDKAILMSRLQLFLNGNKSYTLSLICKPDTLDQLFRDLVSRFDFMVDYELDKYNSDRYEYEIKVPNDFVIDKPSGKNIDLKLIKNDGAIILVNVSARYPDEYEITAHDYSKEILENSYRQLDWDFRILENRKILIENNKAFLIIYEVPSKHVKAMEIYFFKDDNAFTLTGKSGKNEFDSNEETFFNTLTSIKFK